MEERLARLEATVRELVRQVDEIHRRLGALGAGIAPPVRASAEPPPQPALAVAPAASDMAVMLAFAGRSVLVLGGAYLLRALTESGVLGTSVGPLLGLAYAAAWMLAVGRSDRTHREADAAFHATTASLVGFPLIWEATVHFGVLRPTTSAAALGALTGVALLVAWRRNQRSLAWIVTLAGLAATIALIPATGAPLPYAVFLLLLGLATLWLGYVCNWTVLRWPVALAADVVALGLVGRALSGHGSEGVGPVLALLSGLVAGYLASTAARTLVRGREVIPFEVTQTGLALLIGFGGAIAVSRATGTGAHQLGAISLVLAISSYAVAFVFIQRVQGSGINFAFYTSLALVLTLVGGHLLFGPVVLAVLAGCLAVASVWLGARVNQAALHLDGAVYLLAGGVLSGLLASATRLLFGNAGPPIGFTRADTGTVVIAAAICATVAARRGGAGRSAPARLGTLTTLVLLAWGAAGFLVAFVAALSSSTLQRPPSAGGIATIVTVVLSAGTISLAVAGRTRLVEAGWLVYPLLLVTGAKMVMIDLRHSSALLLVLAFASYGVALILAPRLWKAPGGHKTAVPGPELPTRLPAQEGTEVVAGESVHHG